MISCCLRDVNKFLRYRILCKSILKCGFSSKGIKLTRFIPFEVVGVPQVPTILAGTARKFVKYSWDRRIRNFSVLDDLTRYLLSTQSISYSLMVFFRTDGKIQTVREAYTVPRVEVIIFSWCSRGLSPMEWNLKKWILSKNSSCIRR